MSSGGKATFVGIDGPSFTVQYNPREFSTNKTLSWSEAKTAGGDPAKLQYQQGAPMTASMELIFDSTSSSGNVETQYVKPLMALTRPTIPAKSGQAKDLGTLRPPAFMFNWGAFSMPCVIESVDVTYLMFSTSGDPVRAKCSVKLKEWTGDQAAGNSVGAAASSVAGAAASVASLVEVKGGQTLSQVAAANNTTAQAIASLNNISDPMADLTGMKVAIPSAASKAATQAASAATTASNAATTASNAATAASAKVSSAAAQVSSTAKQVSSTIDSVKRSIPRF